jgi:small basic protein (TIGR04137 family)
MAMSIHSSLRSKGALAKHRNVLSRVERIARLEEGGRWKEDTNLVIGLPKVRNIKVRTKKKAKDAVPAEGEAAAAAPTAGATPGAAAPAAAKSDAKGGKK